MREHGLPPLVGPAGLWKELAFIVMIKWQT